MPILGHLGYEGQTFFHWAQRYVPDLLMILSKILTGIKSGAPSRPLGMRACAYAFRVQKTKTKTPPHHHLSQRKENHALSSLSRENCICRRRAWVGEPLGGTDRTTHKNTRTMRTRNKEMARKIVTKESTSSMSWDFSN